MRIAFLTHEPFYPPSGGGSAEAIYLAQEMVRRLHEVHLFCPSFADAESIAKQFEVRLHLFKAWQMGRYTSLRNVKYLAYPVLLQRIVERAAKSVRFDVVLSQHAISAVAAGRLKQRLRVPVVMNFLDYLTGFMETWPRYVAPRSFIKALERFELSIPNRYQADCLMTVSETLADYFANAGYSRERILPIYYGYDSKLFSLAENHAVAAESPPVVVMHGSFDHHHLGDIALGAMRRVAAAKPHVRFRFVGKETPTLTRFRRRALSAVPDLRIESTGFVPYSRVADHLRTASVGMVPYEESTGTHCAFVAKIVEYLGVGLPVVSTPLNSASRYFGNEPAVRFAGFDGESFGRRILEWLDEPVETRRHLGRVASERVHRELDWGAIGKKAIAFVEKIQQQQGRR
ncbi:MAG TPA: glycosyltransferase family 4 protein [Verrucomicrobiae bacterium]|nr:glycosyltransferase family 4 protein [Verrucomicrobiae bacterium]